MYRDDISVDRARRLIEKSSLSTDFEISDRRVILVDDTCTTGKNLLSSIKIMEEKGARVAKVLVVLDRGEGGSLAIKKEGFDFSSLLTVKNNRVVLAD